MCVSRISVTSPSCSPPRASSPSSVGRQLAGPGSTSAALPGAWTSAVAIAWRRPTKRRSKYESPEARIGTRRGLPADYTGGSSSMDLSPPSAVLTAVARLVAESRSLRDVVAGLVDALRGALPFVQLHVLRFDRAESFVLYTAHASGAVEMT